VLSFPLIPYLQFDFGEVAIILALLMFGPIPATGAAIVEFLTLMVLGVNAPIGPAFKIIAILSSIVGIWAGITLLSRRSGGRINRGIVLGGGLGLGLLTRGVVMTIANYFLLAYIYDYSGTVDYLAPFFKLIGLTINTTNGLAIILGFTAIFNSLQLVLVFAISYGLLRLPQLQNSLRSHRMAWYLSAGKNNSN